MSELTDVSEFAETTTAPDPFTLATAESVRAGLQDLANRTRFLKNALASGSSSIQTDRLLGRDTPGDGAVEEISIGVGIELNGSGVLQRSGITGDVSVGAGSNTSVIGAGVVTSAKLRDSAALSVIGRSANSTGVPADIAGTDGQVLRVSGTALGFGTVASAGLRDSAALSVIGRSANSTGVPADIAGTDGQVLRVSGTTLGFGTIASAGLTNNSVTDAILRDSAALSVIGRSANSTGDPADISTTAASGAVLRESGSVVGFGTVATAGIADNAVTLAKIQDIVTDVLIGRDTAASGDPELIGVTGGLEFTGSQTIRRSALTGDVTASAGANATTIAAGVVTSAKLRDSAALSVIGRSANSTGVPADISTTAASGAVLRESGSVVGFGTVATAGISDDAVTNPKAANMATQTIKGRTTAGTGDPEDLTAAQAAAIVGPALSPVVETLTIAAGAITIVSTTPVVRVLIDTEAAAATDDLDTINGGAEGQIAIFQPTSSSRDVQYRDNSVGGGNLSSVLDASFTSLAVAEQIVFQKRGSTWYEVSRALRPTGGLGHSADGSIQIADAGVTSAKLRDSVALSVIGRSANSTGVPADIAGTDGQVLRVSGTALGFGTVASAGLRDSAALSVIGRSANSTGVPADIAGTDGQVLRVSGTALGFGTISSASVFPLYNESVTISAGSISVTTAAASSAAVSTEGGAGSDNLDTISGGISGQILTIRAVPLATITVRRVGNIRPTGKADLVLSATRDTATFIKVGSEWLELAVGLTSGTPLNALVTAAALSVIGNPTNATADLAVIAGTDGQVLRVSGTTLGFGTIPSDAVVPTTFKETLTISAGAITITSPWTQLVQVDTEGAAATDDLVTISGGVDGQTVTFLTTSDARDVVFKHATGNIRLDTAADRTHTSNENTTQFVKTGSNWFETGRATNT
jgi:hypothetical protein